MKAQNTMSLKYFHKDINMRIIVAPSSSYAVHMVASRILEKLLSSPNPVLGLATGKTMIPVYSELVKLVNSSKSTELKGCHFFMLDEYMDLPFNHSETFRNYIQSHVMEPLGLNESQFNFPPVHLSDGPFQYEETLKAMGGIDLQLLGLGRNGHIGFNEPGSQKNSRTRVVKLSDDTIEANRDQFQEIIPTHALSMGIETILDCRELLMLVTGKSKAQTVKYLLSHHDDKTCPATYLKGHPHFTLVLDPEAASRINLNM
jgi:glucosamine-6-phosphate deaminase